jgi:uncharacterized membrane protein
MTTDTTAFRTLRWGALLLGVALSGFFDGILLHQVLQWHHLLSGVQDPAVRSIERQVLADGLFHVLMYAIAAWALWLLWRGRRDLTVEMLARRLPADLLLGFGVWNVVDVVVFHWLAGIHRVRMETPQPLLWDLIWLVVFGVLPIIAAVWLQRRRGNPSGPSSGGPTRQHAGVLAWTAISVMVTAAAYWAGRPPPGETMVLVMYAPGTAGETIVQGIDEVQGRILWANAGGTLWAIDVPGESRLGLYRHGALFASSLGGLAGCAPWTRRVALGAGAANGL